MESLTINVQNFLNIINKLFAGYHGDNKLDHAKQTESWQCAPQIQMKTICDLSDFCKKEARFIV